MSTLILPMASDSKEGQTSRKGDSLDNHETIYQVDIRKPPGERNETGFWFQRFINIALALVLRLTLLSLTNGNRMSRNFAKNGKLIGVMNVGMFIFPPTNEKIIDWNFYIVLGLPAPFSIRLQPRYP